MRHRGVTDPMAPTAVSVVPGTTLRETVEDVVTRAPGLGPSALSAGAVDRLRHEDDDLARK